MSETVPSWPQVSTMLADNRRAGQWFGSRSLNCAARVGHQSIAPCGPPISLRFTFYVLAAMSHSPLQSEPTSPRKEGIPEGLWMRCPECGDMLFRKVVEEAMWVCPACQYHFRVSARTRVEQLVDPGSFEERYAEVEPTDPLRFTDKKAYKDRLRDERQKT